MPEQTMTPKQAATYLGVSDQTIYNWIAAGVLKDVIARGVFKKRYLIPTSEVERVKALGNSAGNNYSLTIAA